MLSTIESMNRYVLQGLNKVAAVTVSPPEFDVLINASMMDYVLQYAKAVDRVQRTIDALRVLRMPPLVIPNTGANEPQQELFEFPYVSNPGQGESHGYLHALNLGLKITGGCADSSKFVSARPVRSDAIYNYNDDPFWEPTPEEPYYYLTGTTARVLAGDGNHATEARLEYLRYPVAVSLVNSVQPELPAHVNQEICNYAIRRHLEVIQSPRYPTNVQESQLNN